MALFIVALVLFIILDISIRFMVKQIQDKKLRQEREAALAVSLRLDFSREAKTLKRVAVSDPKARILCVDDEEIVLGSFRKILVMDGYNVDTVETGQEALGLIQSNHYDFVYTDLRMPSMTGEDVVKSVKHMRPDIDIVVITGYATVESAVECMKFGAMDLIQKPFTETELLDLTKKCLFQRKERIKKQIEPKVFVSQFPEAEAWRSSEFTIPGGAFIAPNHCWATMEPEGAVSIGMDDFAKKLIGRVDQINAPNLGMKIAAGQTLFSIRQGQRILRFSSPVSGTVSKINQGLIKEPGRLSVTPYYNNWVCIVEPDHIDSDIKSMKIGKAAVDFFQDEITSFRKNIKDLAIGESLKENTPMFVGELESLDDKGWNTIIARYFEH